MRNKLPNNTTHAMSKRYIKYSLLSDQEIVNQILSGNEEVVLYLLYDKFAKDIRFFAWKYFESFDIVDDITSELYIYLKGSNLDWSKFRTFTFRSKLRTWMSSIISNFCKEKRKKMIDEANRQQSIDIATSVYVSDYGKTPMDPRIPIMLEAINKLKNEEYRLILIKDLEGYSHADIAKMIIEKRKREGKQRMYNGKLVVPDAHSVDCDKARAIIELRKIMQQIKIS